MAHVPGHQQRPNCSNPDQGVKRARSREKKGARRTVQEEESSTQEES